MKEIKDFISAFLIGLGVSVVVILIIISTGALFHIGWNLAK